MLIVVSGISGSGKTTFCNYLTSEINFHYFNVGRILSEKIQHRFNIQEQCDIGELFFSGKLPEIYHYEIVRSFITPTKNYIIDGLRVYKTYELLKKEFNEFYSIFICIDETIRIERLKNEIETRRNIEERIKKDLYLNDLKMICDKSDYVIINDHKLQDLFNHVKIISKKIN